MPVNSTDFDDIDIKLIGTTATALLPRKDMNGEEQELIIHLIKSNPGLKSLYIHTTFSNVEEFLPSLSALHLPLFQDPCIHPQSSMQSIDCLPVSANTPNDFLKILPRRFEALKWGSFLTRSVCQMSIWNPADITRDSKDLSFMVI